MSHYTLYYIHVRDGTSAKTKLILFPVLPSPAVMVQSPSEVKPGRSAAAQLIALSLCRSTVYALCLSPTVYLSVLQQKWLLCFALRPPSLSSIYLSTIPLLSPLPLTLPLPACVTALQHILVVATLDCLLLGLQTFAMSLESKRNTENKPTHHNAVSVTVR